MIESDLSAPIKTYLLIGNICEYQETVFDKLSRERLKDKGKR